MKEEQNEHHEAPDSKNKHQEKNVSEKPNRGNRKVIGLIALLAILIIGGYFGYTEYEFYASHVETEDAQTDGSINPVLPRVSGYVSNVLVQDNEQVSEGQLLVEIDSTEYVLKVDMADAELKNAQASVEVAQANLESAQVALNKANVDYNRIQDLYEGGATTKSQFDDVESARESAQSSVETAKRRLSEAKAMIKTKEDDLEFAQLQLSYTKIKAPSDGLVSKKNVSEGQLIQPGQPLMAVTNVQEVWVVANFKETELSEIKIGQSVNINIDAYPDQTFHGKVQSIAGATGAKYALLPPENATGNFVKVVQRIPVKIEFTDASDPNYPIRLGLNVVATIDVTTKGSLAASGNGSNSTLSHK